MSYYTIPLLTTNQKFNINLNGSSYKLQLIYRASKWFLDIFDAQNTPLICGLPLACGDNLLVQHQHIISGTLFVINDDEKEIQRFSDLGKNITLFWSPLTWQNSG